MPRRSHYGYWNESMSVYRRILSRERRRSNVGILRASVNGASGMLLTFLRLLSVPEHAECCVVWSRKDWLPMPLASLRGIRKSKAESFRLV